MKRAFGISGGVRVVAVVGEDGELGEEGAVLKVVLDFKAGVIHAYGWRKGARVVGARDLWISRQRGMRSLRTIARMFGFRNSVYPHVSDRDRGGNYHQKNIDSITH